MCFTIKFSALRVKGCYLKLCKVEATLYSPADHIYRSVLLCDVGIIDILHITSW